jgi:hypothetical protein
MKLTTQQQADNTKKKLAELETLYAKYQTEPVQNKAAREQTLRSLKRAINQLKEEIARFQVEKTTA